MTVQTTGDGRTGPRSSYLHNRPRQSQIGQSSSWACTLSPEEATMHAEAVRTIASEG